MRIFITKDSKILNKVASYSKKNKKLGAALNLPIVDPKTFNRKEPYALFIGTQRFPPDIALDLFDVFGEHPMITESNARPTVTLDTLIKEHIPVIGKSPRAGDKQPAQDLSGVMKTAAFPSGNWAESAWISPEGEVIDTEGVSHEDAIFELLDDEKKYDSEDINTLAISKGWTRFGEMGGGGDTGANVKSLRNINPAVFNHALKYTGQNKEMVVADLSGKYVHMPVDEFVLGQKAVNKAIQVQKTAKLGSSYDFSSTHFLLPKELSEKIIRWAIETIPEEQIIHDEKDPGTKGIQLDSHITLKYGLHTNDFEDVKKALEGQKAPHIKFGTTSFFEPEGKDYDVVIIQVESDDLQKLNEKLCNNVEHDDLQFKEYHPHVTIAYVQRGKGVEFDGKDIITGEELVLPELIFSPKTGEKRTLELKGTNKESSFMPSNTDLAPSDDWAGTVGYPTNESMDAPQNVSDEETWRSPENDRPRSKNFLKRMLSLFQKPLSKKEPKEIVPVKEAEVSKKANSKQYWIDPNGTFYPLEGELHKEWIQNNFELLQTKYGFKIPDLLFQQREDYNKEVAEGREQVETADVYGIWEQMINQGWIRIGDGKDWDSGYQIELRDIHHIPNYVDNFVSENPTKQIEVEDKQKNFVTIVNPASKDINKAVNQALRSPTKTATVKEASSNVFFIDTDSGLKTKVLRDPTPEQAMDLYTRTRGEFHQIRWVVPNDGHLYMWDAYDLTHWDAIQQLGIPTNQLKEDTNSGVIYNSYEAKSVVENFQEGSLLKKAFKQWTTPEEPTNNPKMDWKWADSIYKYVDENWQDLLSGWMNLDPKNYVKPVIAIEKIYEDAGTVTAWVHIEFVNTNGNTDAFMKLILSASIEGSESIEPEGREFSQHLTDWEIDVKDYGKSDELEKTSSVEKLVSIGKFDNADILVPEDLLNKYIATISQHYKGLSPQEAYAMDLERSYLHKQLINYVLKNTLSNGLDVKYDKDVSFSIDQLISDFAEAVAYKENSPRETEKESSYGPTHYQGPSVADHGYQNSAWDDMNVTYSPEEDEELMDQNGDGGYPNRWMGRHRGPYYTNEGKVVKMLEDTTPQKQAASGNITLWLASDGKEYPVTKSHHNWILENTDLLKKKYGIDVHVKEYSLQLLSRIEARLVAEGWVRIDGILPNEIDLEVADIHNIPQVAEQFVWKYKPEVVIVEDLKGEDISFDKEEYSKGLMKKAAISGEVTNHILNLIHQNGGATWNMAKGNLVGQPYFAVAIYPQKEQIVDEADFDNLEGYLTSNEGLLSNSNNSFGAWVSNGKTYYDVVTTITDKNEAMKLGQQHNQLAIFSLKDMKEIPLSRTAKLAAVYSDRQMQKEYDKIYSERWPDDSAPIDGGNEYYDWSELGSNDYPNPKDEEKEHVYMDMLDDPAVANFPAGLPEYWVTFYDSNPNQGDQGGI